MASVWKSIRHAGMVFALSVAAAMPAKAQNPVPPGFVGGGDQSQLSVRADQLESQVRTLTGQVEQLTFQLQQVQEQLQRMSEDLEYRFQELGGKPGRQGTLAAPPPANAAHQPRQQGQFVGQTGQAVGTVQGQPLDQGFGQPGQLPPQDLAANGSQALGAPPQNLGTLPANEPLSILPPGQDINNQDFTAQDGLQQPGSVALAVPEDPQTSYDVAYAFILQQDYPAAEQAFGTFLQTYPRHALAGNAQFWLGESYFARQQYREAADTFLAGYQNYKASPKGAEMLLRLGMSLKELGQKEAACASLDEISRSYPQASKGVKDQARQEKKRAGC